MALAPVKHIWRVLVVTSSRIPASLRYLENPEGIAATTSSFWDVRRLASPEASRPLSRCVMSKDAQGCWSEKAEQAF